MIIQLIHFLITKNKIVKHFFGEWWNATPTKSVKNGYGISESLSASNKGKCSNIAITEKNFTFANLNIKNA